MRQRGRIDDNHIAIVKALRQVGCSVKSLAALGKGYPDLLVGRCGVNYLFEVKDGTKAPSRRRLTADEQRFRDLWSGQYAVVESPELAVSYVLRDLR